MGKAVAERGGLKYSGPSKIAEAIVAVFVPPACREEVVGDLHERYSSPGQYCLDALRTVPLVIISRMRRTADPQVFLMQAFVWYASFLGAAWLKDGAFLTEQWGLVRLAIPVAMAMLGLILDDTYAKPGRRSPLKLSRGPALALGLALASQGMFRISNPGLAVPSWVAVYGCVASFLLSSAVRMLFPPVSDQLQGINVPAHWLKRSGESLGNLEISTRILKIFGVLIAGTWMADRAALPKPVTLLLILLIAYVVWERG